MGEGLGIVGLGFRGVHGDWQRQGEREAFRAMGGSYVWAHECACVCAHLCMHKSVCTYMPMYIHRE